VCVCVHWWQSASLQVVLLVHWESQWSRGTGSDGGNSSGVKESLNSDDHAASGSSTLRVARYFLKGYTRAGFRRSAALSCEAP
jgi:hypothetical protein